MRRPRWRHLYGAVVAVGAAIALARTFAPRMVPDLVSGLALVGALVAVMAGWVRSNASELDMLDWCECASSEVHVRVVTSRSPWPVRRTIADVPAPAPEPLEETVPA